jgi:hypothetical protein
VFVTASVLAPARFARRSEESVSAVSPLWVTATGKLVFGGDLRGGPNVGVLLEEFRRIEPSVIRGAAGDELHLLQ